MARAFYQEYGVTSLAIAATALVPTQHSKIVDVQTHPGFTHSETFLKVMHTTAARLSANGRKLLLVPCGDAYSELVSKHQDELHDEFIFVAQDYHLLKRLNYKTTFYQICEENDLPYPKTYVIEHQQSVAEIGETFPLRYPVALKPADSVAYLSVDFPGRKKAYIIDDARELQTVIDSIYAAGYTRELILQDYIPGDDSHMRVLNAYVDRGGRVRMMSLGHPMLEDPSPQAIGNYMAILPDYNEQIYHTFKAFLEKIDYTGFANFDIKYDARDDSYRVFEINLRQGRSSFYVTLNGDNLAKYLVSDYIDNEYTEPTNQVVTHFANQDESRHKLWLGLPAFLFKKYATDNPAKSRALKLLRAKKVGTTLRYRADMNVARAILLLRMSAVYVRNFHRHYKAKL